ncbi:MAG: hypothetical protein ACLSAC_21940 [Enterocloster bolteae]
MRPISFSGMEDAITVQKPNGTHVNYHIFEESEIHLNRITPGECSGMALSYPYR